MNDHQSDLIKYVPPKCEKCGCEIVNLNLMCVPCAVKQAEPVAQHISYEQDARFEIIQKICKLGQDKSLTKDQGELLDLFNHLENEIALLKKAQLVQPVGAQSWEPIKTAPKDNKRALYLARFNESGELVELDFNGAWEYWQESWELAHINGYAWVSENGIEEPTHWAYQDLPLPKSLSAPAAAINEELLSAASEFIKGYENENRNGLMDMQVIGEELIRLAEAIRSAEAAKKGGV